MGFFSKIFGKKEEGKVAGMENYMTLIRVYFQAAIACLTFVSSRQRSMFQRLIINLALARRSIVKRC